MNLNSETSSTRNTNSFPIEVGLIISGSLDAADEEALFAARDQTLQFLKKHFEIFKWQMPIVRREEANKGAPKQPIQLIQGGSEEREARNWDFGLVVTSSDLVSHYKPFALAVVSRSLDLSLISTSRIDPWVNDPGVDKSDRVKIMTVRLKALMIHSLGHLNGLSHLDESGNFMTDIETVEDLEGIDSLNSHQNQIMNENLLQVADQRLEESQNAERSFVGSFYIRGLWLNRHEILDAVWQAKPWEFPVRLTRLTTAAASALVILMLTAETWDLALSQSGWGVTLLLSCVMVSTTLYVAIRQRLLVQRQHRRVSEQSVITNSSALLIVGLGMFCTAFLLFAVSLFGSLLLYPRTMIGSWATSVQGTPGIEHYFLMATFVASLGVAIGALGATFEEEHHFRHIVFIDEET